MGFSFTVLSWLQLDGDLGLVLLKGFFTRTLMLLVGWDLHRGSQKEHLQGISV